MEIGRGLGVHETSDEVLPTSEPVQRRRFVEGDAGVVSRMQPVVCVSGAGKRSLGMVASELPELWAETRGRMPLRLGRERVVPSKNVISLLQDQLRFSGILPEGSAVPLSWGSVELKLGAMLRVSVAVGRGQSASAYAWGHDSTVN